MATTTFTVTSDNYNKTNTVTIATGDTIRITVTSGSVSQGTRYYGAIGSTRNGKPTGAPDGGSWSVRATHLNNSIYSGSVNINSTGTYTISLGGIVSDQSTAFGGSLKVTVKAPVTYYSNLYYNANGGSGGPSDNTTSTSAVSQPDPRSVTIPRTTVPTRSGYTFAGWATTSDATSVGYQPGGTISVPYSTSSAGITLYAVWKRTYYSNLYYNANTGTGAPSNDTYSAEGIGGAPSNRQVTISPTVPTKANHRFVGWSTDQSATSASYQPNGTIYVPYTESNVASVTLYAVWIRQYTVTYDGNGVASPASQTVDAGQSVTLPSVSWNYHTFNGWYNGATRVGGAGSSYAPTSDITLTASWTIYSYTVTLNVSPSGYGTTTGSGTYDHGSVATLTAVPNTGFRFTYWDDGNTSASRTVEVTGSFTRTAFFAMNSYRVVFHANGGQGTMSDESYTYTESKALTANAFTWYDHTFLGWATSASGSKVYDDGQIVSALSSTDNDVIDLYAVWSYIGPNVPPSIQFKKWDGSAGERVRYTDMARIENALNTLLTAWSWTNVSYNTTPSQAGMFDYRDANIIEGKTAELMTARGLSGSSFTGWTPGYVITYRDMERIEANLYAVYANFGGTTPRIDA